MSVLGKETVVSTFAKTQLVPIIVCVEMDIIFIKMKKLAWVGSVFIFIKIRNLPWVVIVYSNLHLLSLAFTIISEVLLSLHESVHIRSYSGSYFPAFVLNTERSECGKRRTRITPNMDTFYTVYIV